MLRDLLAQLQIKGDFDSDDDTLEVKSPENPVKDKHKHQIDKLWKMLNELKTEIHKVKQELSVLYTMNTPNPDEGNRNKTLKHEIIVTGLDFIRDLKMLNKAIIKTETSSKRKTKNLTALRIRKTHYNALLTIFAMCLNEYQTAHEECQQRCKKRMKKFLEITTGKNVTDEEVNAMLESGNNTSCFGQHHIQEQKMARESLMVDVDANNTQSQIPTITFTLENGSQQSQDVELNFLYSALTPLLEMQDENEDRIETHVRQAVATRRSTSTEFLFMESKTLSLLRGRIKSHSVNRGSMSSLSSSGSVKSTKSDSMFLSTSPKKVFERFVTRLRPSREKR